MRKHDRYGDGGARRNGVAAGISLACALSVLIGARLSLVPLPGDVPWPPAGIALVALLVFGYNMWLAVLGGIFAGAWLLGAGAPTASAIAVVGTIEAFLGAWIANRWACGVDSMARTKCFVRFAVGTGVIAAAVGPVLGFPALALIGRAPEMSVAAAALSWWLGDSVSTLVVAPCLLLLLNGSPLTNKRRSIAEMVSLAAALGLTWFALFSGWLPPSVAHYPLEVLCVPALLWTAYRFGPRIAALAVVGLAVIALGGTRAGAGPFAVNSPLASLVVLQAFIGVSAVTTLVLATVTYERRAAEQRLIAMARTDGLTGLANYRSLVDALEDEVQRSMRRGHTFALLFLDLDRLKQINDTLGHLAGNRAIIRVANALSVNCRSIDTAARLGGDEFCVLLPDTDEVEAGLVSRRVAATLAVPWDGPRVKASCGVAMYPRDGATGEELLAAADTLLYRAKAGRTEPARATPTRNTPVRAAMAV